MINYSETLTVKPSAGAEDIKSAYRQMAKRFHPDVDGGDPVRFARIGEAYEVLSDPKKKQRYDQALQAARMQAEAPPEPRSHPGAGAPPRRPQGPGPPTTRLMSMRMQPNGRFLMEGMTGKFKVEPTTPENLWETTLKKFGGSDPAVLAKQALQIRLNGPREVVRQMVPSPTEFGVQFQGAGSNMFGKEEMRNAFMEGNAGSFLNPHQMNLHDLVGAEVTVEATVPPGTAVYLYDMAGDITLGDTAGELVVTLDGKSVLRAGLITKADLTLDGMARARVDRLNGEADVIVVGQGKLLLGGEMDRLRTVIENHGHVEVVGPVVTLQATVSGRGYLNVKGEVGIAHCDVRAGGYAKLAKVSHGLSGQRSGGGQIDVIQGPPEGSQARAFGLR